MPSHFTEKSAVGSWAYRWIAGAFAIGVAGTAAAADSPVFTQTNFRVETVGGVPAFCSFDFTMLYKDFVTQQGALAMITGSLLWFEKDSNIQAGLKLAGADVPGDPTTAKHFSINQGFVAIKDKPIAPGKTTRGLDPKDILAIYPSASADQIFGGLFDNTLSIVFNREVGALDEHLLIAVDFGAAEKSHDLQDFKDCIAAIVKQGNAHSTK